MKNHGLIELVGVYKLERNPDVFLVELIIDESPASIDVSTFSLPDDKLPRDSWQAAFNEHFLNEDGTTVVGTFLNQESLVGNMTRLAFFMYFADKSKTLITAYGEVRLSQPTHLPERLSRIIDFEIID